MLSMVRGKDLCLGVEWLGLSGEKIPKEVQTDFPVGYSQSREENDVMGAQHAEGPGQA